MPRPRHRCARTPCAGLASAVLSLALIGCADDGEAGTEADLEQASYRLGRVHVVLAPDAQDVDGEFEVTARFAFVRGLDEEFVRARIDMPVLAHESLQTTQCTSDTQWDAGLDVELGDDPRELLLVDAGNMQVNIGDASMQVPLSLVPDLLPYMTGVEYMYYGEGIPVGDTDGSPRLEIEADGSQIDDLPPFSVEGAIPPAIDLESAPSDRDEIDRGALVLRWDGASDDTVTVRITPLTDGEPVGDELTCVFADLGMTRIDLAELHTYGLPYGAEALRVSVSRFETATFDAGDYEGTELIVERRDVIAVSM